MTQFSKKTTKDLLSEEQGRHEKTQIKLDRAEAPIAKGAWELTG
jgi:hypothetical protein